MTPRCRPETLIFSRGRTKGPPLIWYYHHIIHSVGHTNPLKISMSEHLAGAKIFLFSHGSRGRECRMTIFGFRGVGGQRSRKRDPISLRRTSEKTEIITAFPSFLKNQKGTFVFDIWERIVEFNRYFCVRPSCV